MATEPQSHTGVFQSFRWRNNDADSPYIIGQLEDGTVVQGPMPGVELMPGITYEFHASGRNTGWIENHHGRSFKFTVFAVKIPHTKHGVVAYLQRYGKWVGPAIGSKIYDVFGPDSVKMLRTQPADVVAVPEIGRVLTLDKALKCADLLEEHAILEDTKISLTNLFAGRGFPSALIEACIYRWKILAPERIKRDPYTLLVNRLPGCGFARCDSLYLDLGLPRDRLKRQTICLWHVLYSDTSGNTWVRAEDAIERLRQMVSTEKMRPKRALKLGTRAGWIASKRDREGTLWLADGGRARNEQFVAEQLQRLSGWTTTDTTELRSLCAAAHEQSEEDWNW